ncbi:MAG: polysaccharide deacetylase family protein [Pseudomonadota bacterium]
MKRPLLFLHVDVDNLWIGEKEWGVKPSGRYEIVYEQALPLFLELLSAAGLHVTFFMVGQDLGAQSCKAFCRAAQAAGHRFANHTYSHPLNPARLDYREKVHEIQAAHDVLVEVSGSRPIGFRAPGYFLDDHMLGILMDMGYRYDSSVLPGVAVGLMQLYSWWTSPGSEKLFGQTRYLYASRRPRLLGSGMRNEQSLIEFPISVMPILRLPIHTTFAYLLGETYLSAGLSLLRLSRGPHVYLFHAVDLLDLPEEASYLRAYYPALRIPLNQRIRMISDILGRIKAHFSCVTTEEFVAEQGTVHIPGPSPLA